MSDLTRRDFINGSLMMAGTSMLPVNGSSQAVMAALEPSYYPPSLNGLRGSHPGSNDAAHARVWAKQSNWGPTSNLREVYDLVVVGGGISGLAAAYFYQQEHGRDKKILILDNHDDFGGHAKRNEHDVDGNILIGEGGSETIEQTGALSEIVLNLLKDLGLDLNRFQMTYDSNFFKKHGLGAATYFNQRVFGEDKVVRHPFGGYPGFMEGLLRSTLSYENAVEQAPLSKSGKQQLLRVLQSNPKTLNIPKSQWQEYVQTHTYFNYLKNTLGVDDPRVLRMARHSVVDYGGTPDVMTMQEALESSALGMDAVAWNEALEGGDAPVDYIDKGDGTYASKDPFIHHFPDGNATIARMLVKKMVPEVGPGENVEEIVLSKFNYDKLDLAKNNVRIRLSSTVVNVKHLGNPLDSDAVMVNYIQGGESYQVKAKNTILACY
ncbi:MAG: FAD-dependent oxidoreductase, partial [Woeseiaceae bacterium]|nr:FAD-dependent oxidoreductase [Woeseiaceae bacterium]